MASPKTAEEILDDCYLEVRAKLIEIAASLDRVDRADSSGIMDDDPLRGQFREAFEILKSRGFDRAERIQLLFSDEYEPNWNTHQL